MQAQPAIRPTFGAQTDNRRGDCRRGRRKSGAFYYFYSAKQERHHGCKNRPRLESHPEPEFEKPYFAELTRFVREEYASRRIYPRGSNIFRAFDKCPFERLKVVIIGQDPYHGPGQANGLCFSVGDGVPFPLRCRTSSRR